MLRGESPRCHLERISADLGDDDVRRELLRDIASRTSKLVVLTEGVTPYLSNDQVSILAADLGAIEGRIWWINDYFSEAVHRYRKQSGVSARMREAPFLFRPGDWFHFFAERGWRVREIRYLPIEGRKMGRPFPVPRRVRSFKSILTYLFRPKLRKELGTSFGFAMMEPAISSDASTGASATPAR
jgi:O-methyltransferase involved in polyketide biosynthesis